MRTLLTALLLIFSMASGAQDYKFKHYDVGNGLSNNKVNSVYKDSDGFLWVGTSSGLNRFDGNKFKNYLSSNDDEKSLLDNYVGKIQEDASGNLYIECGGTYVVYKRMEDCFDRNVNELLRLPDPSITPRELFIDSDKNIWIYDSAYGLYCLRFGVENPIEITKDDKRILKDRVSDINESENYILFITRSGCVYAVNRNTMKMEWSTCIPYNTTYDTDYSSMGDGARLWVYSVYGIYTLDLKAHTWMYQTPTISPNTLVNAIGKDNKGNIWIGMDRLGVSVIDKYGNLINLSGENGFESMSVASLYTDNNGSVWIGTFKKGLYQYNEDMYKFQLASFPDVNCVAGNIFEANVAWLGTDNGELVKWDYINNSSERYQVSKNAIVCALTQKRGEVWVGTYLDGLKSLSDGQIKTYHLNEGLAAENVWALCGSTDERIWIGTMGGGVQLFDPRTEKFETYNSQNSALCSDYVNSMIQSRGGNLYVGTTGGVSVFNYSTKSFTNVTDNRSGKAMGFYPNVIQLAEDRHGLLWIATVEGLYVLNEATDHLTEVEIPKKSNPFVLGMAEDNGGDMWVTIGAEVIKIVTTIDSNKRLSFDFSFYNQKDGLQNSDFNQRSLFRTPTGVMVVGGLYGVNFFNPQSIKYNKNAPHVLFSDIQLFHQSIKVGMKYNGHVILAESLNAGKNVDLKYSQNDFTIDFASDNFIVPENTKYYYRLVGFNSDWIECEQGIHQATYTNLSPGEYTFEVRAVNNDGIESEESASLHIYIHPPFWATVWAMIYYFIVFIGMTIIVIRFVRQKDKVKYLKAQEEEEIRHKEELAQLELKFFTNISHDLRTPLTLILAPLDKLINNAQTEKDKGRLGMVKSNANRLLQMVNQLLDYRKIETSGLNFIAAEGDIVSFVGSVCEGFNELAENRNINFSFNSTVEQLDMTFDADKMNKLCQNLLSNAFKFTPSGGSISVDMSTAGDYMIMKVADTGIGIPENEKPMIFSRYYQTHNTVAGGTGIGLSLVKEYAKSHNGNVEVEDNPGGGTVFVVTIPIVYTKSQAEQEAERAMEAPLNSPDEKANGKYVALIVDDDEELLRFMYEELSTDYKVLRARDGVEALEVMKSELPDIVCTDVMMPNMDGVELCRHIKVDKRMASIPVILLSSKYNLDTKVDGLTAGADDYLTKPFNLEVLRLRMRKMIELKNRGGKGDAKPDGTPNGGPDGTPGGKAGGHEYAAATAAVVTSAGVELNSLSEGDSPLDERLVDEAIRYIDRNIERDTLSAEELIMHVGAGLSKLAFYRRLRKLTGKTPMELILTIKMKKAAQLLSDTKLNVSEVAYRVGYSSPQFFSVQFKKAFGMSPSEYQENMKDKLKN